MNPLTGGLWFHVARAAPTGLALADDVVARADALDWPPLAARAREARAVFLNRMGKAEEAESGSIDAYIMAAKSEAWTVATNAAIHLVVGVGYKLGRTDLYLRTLTGPIATDYQINTPTGPGSAAFVGCVGT